MKDVRESEMSRPGHFWLIGSLEEWMYETEDCMEKR